MGRHLLDPSAKEKEHVEQMMKELVEEVENWDKDPKPASLRWTSTDAKKENEDIVFEPAGGKHTPPLADEFRILGHLFSRDGRMQISLEERCRAPTKHGGERREGTPMQERAVEHEVSKGIWIVYTIFHNGNYRLAFIF